MYNYYPLFIKNASLYL